MTGNKSKFNYKQTVDGVKLLGEPYIQTLTRQQFLAFQRRNIFLDERKAVQQYARAVNKHQVIHSHSYERYQKRNNCCVKLLNNEIFDIDTFVVVEIEDKTCCYVIGRYFDKLKQPFLRERKLTHMCMIKNNCDSLGIVDPSDIIERVTIIPIKNASSVACIYPNRHGLLD